MGSKSSVEVGPPEGPIVDIMRREYGDKSLKYLNVWTTEFGFPIGGSLSLKNLLVLEGKLKGKEQEMRRKNKVSVRKLENIEGQKECLQMWKGEAETRNRKILQKQLPFPCEKLATNEMQASHTQRTQDSQISSLFPQLAALKLDPDLDGSPPTNPSAPPPYNITPLSTKGETDSTLPQQKTSSGTTHCAPDVPVPSQDPTTEPLSPIAHRLRRPNQEAAFIMPMVEVSGSEGATLVFRPWTSADITAASQHLPNPATSVAFNCLMD